MADQQLAKNPQTLEGQAGKSMNDLILKYRRSLELMLGEVAQSQRFMTLVINSVRVNPKLAGCTPLSFLNSFMLAAQLKIEIRKDSAYLVPFGSECSLLIDYRAKIEMARRNPDVTAISLNLVHEGDEFDYNESSAGVTYHHVPLLWRKKDGRQCVVSSAERGEVVLGYSVCRLKGGEPQVDLMSLEQIEAIRARSKNGCARDFKHYGQPVKGLSLAEIRKIDASALDYKSPYRLPWVTDWDQMARKTLAHRGAKYWPQPVDRSLAVSQEIDDAGETGTPAPMAAGLEAFAAELDPADNRPLIDSPLDPEEARAKQEEIVERKTYSVASPTTKKDKTQSAQEKTGQVMTEPGTEREISGAPDPGPQEWTPSDEEAARNQQAAKGPQPPLFGGPSQRFKMPPKKEDK